MRSERILGGLGMSFSEWKEIKLGELLNFRRGHDLPKTKMLDGNIPVVGSNGIIGFHNEVTTKAPCLTIGRSGNIGNPCYINKDCWAHNTSLYVDDFKGNDPKYLYYLLKTLNLGHYGGGSAVPTLNRNHIHPIEIKATINLAEQKAIAHILSTLDDKIEVNNQINKTLENMAQAIFKQWFVDFEFPNHNGEPYKSSGGEMVESELGTIPKGWEVVQFRDIFRFVKGKKPKTIAECEFKDSEKYLTIDVLNRNSVLFCSKEKVIEANSEDVLMVMDGASSGAVYFGQKGVVASTLAKLELISQKVSNQFLFYAIKYFENDIKTHTTGSAIPHTDKEYTYRLMIALPNDISLQTKIDDLLCDISDTFIAREQENAVLKATRDTLLPKLMSGEIRVPLDQDGYAS